MYNRQALRKKASRMLVGSKLYISIQSRIYDLLEDNRVGGLNCGEIRFYRGLLALVH